jgi:uncharacterized protein
MAVSRSDTITGEQKKLDLYSDFPNNFTKHPVTNDIIVLKNEDSVRQAFKNLILTNIGEKLFNPFFGSNVTANLFENFDIFLVENLTRIINLAAAQFEPRVVIQNISILPDQDYNTFSINIVFSLINIPQPINLNIPLRRVR